jgi:HK97 family phage prohead protease
MAERQINVTIEGDTARLAVADFRALLNDRERRALEGFERRCGVFGGRETRTAPLEVEKTGNSGDPESPGYYVRGHAAVYNRKSLDLGGFQEKIDAAAFNDVLDSDPDVHLNWDHDMRYTLARTRSAQYLLELRSDPRGLHYYAKVAPTSFAADLRILMEGGVIDQASFAFTVADDTWEIVNRDKPDEYVLRTITRVGELFDVTITAQGAYPQTDSQVVRSYALAYAASTGRLDSTVERGAISDEAAPETPVGAEETPAAADDSRAGEPPLDTEGGDVQSTTNPLLRALRLQSRQAVGLHRSLLEKTDEQD